MANFFVLLTSIFAVIVAIGSLAVTLATEVRARTPVLVFVFDEPKGVWELHNVGVAPAHNVVVAQSCRPVKLKRGVNEAWCNPVLVPAIPAGGSRQLAWLEPFNKTWGLGVSYTDAGRRFHTDKCGNDVNFVFDGLHIPRWPIVEVVDGQRVVRPAWEVVRSSRTTRDEWSRVELGDVVRPWWLLRRYGICRRMGSVSDPVGQYRKLWLHGNKDLRSAPAVGERAADSSAE